MNDREITKFLLSLETEDQQLSYLARQATLVAASLEDIPTFISLGRAVSGKAISIRYNVKDLVSPETLSIIINLTDDDLINLLIYDVFKVLVVEYDPFEVQDIRDIPKSAFFRA